jgi:cellulose synthase (UDP-forming)
MSGLTQHQPKKISSQPLDLVVHLDLIFHSLGDISNQNWTLGNEYRPARNRDNFRLDKVQIPTNNRLAPGELRSKTRHKDESINRGGDIRGLIGTIDRDLNVNPLAPEIWRNPTQRNQRQVDTVAADADVQHFQSWIQTSPRPLLIDILSSRERTVFIGLVSLWATTLIWFWHWWLQPQHLTSIEGAIVCSILLAWNTILPAYYFFFVWRMKRPNPSLNLPSDWRVAMVVTKAPSEPWAVVENTLKAMLTQDYPHDNWLADEQPTPETLAWCRAHQVKVSTRHGVAAYHRSTWPRRTKCKEGNLAYFYDHYGYDQYDFVAQLDADHIPTPGYLQAILRPFINDRVGYVAAPSICGANAERSWVVNARLFAESTMHGSLQAGYSNGWAPLCIGSHYAIRTKAVREIGGLGAELAEDHTTTLMMNSFGWRGAFALDAEAHGDGPTSFADFLVQEFQWARSLVIVLLSITPRYLGALPPHLKFQFLFSQFWYPIFALTMLIGSLLPALALVGDRPWMNVDYFEFLTRSFLLTITCILPVMLVKRSGTLRPHNAKIISWEMVLFQFARWPWVLMAVCSATISCISGREVPFKITPKGQSNSKPLPFPLIVPYLILALISGLAILLCRDVERAQGYYFLAGLNMAIYSGLCLLVLQLHFRENILRYRDYLHHYSATGLIFGLLSIAFSIHLEKGVKAILIDYPVLKSLLAKVDRPPSTSISRPDSQPDVLNRDTTGNLFSQPIDRVNR